MSKEAMKLAHDALRIVRFCVPPAQRPTVEKAMQALEEALAQLQRTWVGLMDDEMWQVVNDCTIGSDLHADKFAQTIEAKLKEKNT